MHQLPSQMYVCMVMYIRLFLFKGTSRNEQSNTPPPHVRGDGDFELANYRRQIRCGGVLHSSERLHSQYIVCMYVCMLVS